MTGRGVRGIIWFVLGYLIIHAGLYAMQLWADVVTLDGVSSWHAVRDAFGLSATANDLCLGVAGGVLGLLGGVLGFGVYRRPNVLRALFYTPIGYAATAALVMLIRMAFGLDVFAAKPVLAVALVGSFLFFLWGVGAFDYWIDYAIGRPTPEHEDHSGHGARNWKSYFSFNTDHKVIGIQYTVTTFFFMVISGAMAELIRAELANPGLQYVTDGNAFNGVFSMHAILMIFLFIIPVFAGLANFVVPIMLGAPDMAFPRLNALSFWFLLFGGFMFLAAFFVEPFASGWTNYAPLSTSFTGEIGLGQVIFGIAVQLVGASSIATAINFIVTIIGMRAPGMTMWRMPLLVWANFTTSILVVFGTPFIAGSQFMVLFDSVMGTHFFDAMLGGDSIMYQHVFWFYSHPAVYIMMLPGFGIISEVITSGARKPIFGYRALAMSTVAIGFLGFTVWAHHMFTSGMAPWLRLPMMITTMLIAVPTGIKVLGWCATLWGGRIHITTQMLFALGFIFTFTVGGLTGIMLASVPFDISVSDSYFVVAHIHYVLFGGSLMTIMAGVYHWFPKMTGRMYSEKLGRASFWTIFIGMNMAFFPMHWLGTLGMPRRVADYQALAKIHESVHPWNFIVTIGALVMAVGFVIFFYNMVTSWIRGPKAPGNPWRAHTLEWLVSSPPPLFNFYATPKVVGEPYGYGTVGNEHAIVYTKQQAQEMGAH
jgi:cytochrome c oxidase subunit 1